MTAGRLRGIFADTAPLRLDRDYRWLWTGQAVNGIGNQITRIALPFQVYVLTGSTLAVAGLMKIAVDKGRSTKPGIELGICGEHGGDPESIFKCEAIGLDYVSCSPFRVPVARLAAAQAALAGAAERDK